MAANRTGNISGTPYRMFRKQSEIPSPSRTWLLFDEREDSIKQAIFTLPGFSSVQSPGSLVFQNWPASYHNRAGSLNFTDVHSEIRKWKDPRTVPVLKKGQQLGFQNGVASPSNADLWWLFEHDTTLK